MNNIKIEIINYSGKKDFLIPTYATPGSSGLDLRACLNKTVTIASQQTILIPSGIAVYIKNPNVAALVLPRSGLGHTNGIVLGNLVGLIDSDYQGQLMISLWNRSEKEFNIYPNDRIAQIIFIPVIKPNFSLVKRFQTTSRSKKGFGHTGIV
jgi:dUTP pyrophosphatase